MYRTTTKCTTLGQISGRPPVNLALFQLQFLTGTNAPKAFTDRVHRIPVLLIEPIMQNVIFCVTTERITGLI